MVKYTLIYSNNSSGFVAKTAAITSLLIVPRVSLYNNSRYISTMKKNNANNKTTTL